MECSANKMPPIEAALIDPSAVSAPPAFKHMDDNSAFRFHDRFEESEFSSAETAVMV
jgi:hypothetical protein